MQTIASKLSIYFVLVKVAQLGQARKQKLRKHKKTIAD